MTYAPTFKRLFDLVFATVLMVLLAPLATLVAIAVRLQLGAPVLFRQQRPGLMGRPFTLVKFRTMHQAHDAHDAQGVLRPDRERLSAFGRALRASSLDELPELWNVLRGDMSLVGPRPLLMEYLPLYSDRQARRHLVKPGVTGWAQTNGRNGVPWSERFELDVWYVEHVSFSLDVRILFATIGRVLARSGVAEPGSATMTPFAGQSGHAR